MSVPKKRKLEGGDDSTASKCPKRDWFAFRFNQDASGKDDTDKIIISEIHIKIAKLRAKLDNSLKEDVPKLEAQIAKLKDKIVLIKTPISFEAFKVLQERSRVDYFELFEQYFVRIFYEPNAVIQELIVGETPEDAETIRARVNEIAARFKKWDEMFVLSNMANKPSVEKVIKTIQKMNW